MKAKLTEFKGCFVIELVADTMEEAATMVRFGMNQVKELRSSETYAGKTIFTASVVIGKAKQETCKVPRARR